MSIFQPALPVAEASWWTFSLSRAVPPLVTLWRAARSSCGESLASSLKGELLPGVPSRGAEQGQSACWDCSPLQPPFRRQDGFPCPPSAVSVLSPYTYALFSWSLSGSLLGKLGADVVPSFLNFSKIHRQSLLCIILMNNFLLFRRDLFFCWKQSVLSTDNERSCSKILMYLCSDFLCWPVY